MKLRTDDRARLYGRDILKPNTDYQAETDGNRIVLVEMVPKSAEPRPNKVRFVQENGRTVGIVEGANFDQAVIKELLAEFP